MHLINCKVFAALMMGLEVIDRPEWFVEGVANKKAKNSTLSIDRKKQASILTYALPHLTQSEHDKAEELIALHYYLTGTPFSRVEEPHLLQLLQLYRPDARLPDRKLLAGKLLKKVYDATKSKVERHLKVNDNYICITTDAWSNIKNEPVVDYMAIANKSSLFLEAVWTREQSHNADWIASDIIRVIEKFGSSVCGVVTDNTATNKKAWKILKEKYPTSVSIRNYAASSRT
jgi:hypothetical protein